MKAFAISASLGCLIAGVYLVTLKAQAPNSLIEAIAHGLGIYFLAKAFFVGPALWVHAEQRDTLNLLLERSLKDSARDERTAEPQGQDFSGLPPG